MIRMLDHEMDVERKLGVLSHGRDHGGTEGNIVHEMAIHDVEMQPIGAGIFGAMDLGFETREVRGEDGWSDESFRRDHDRKRTSNAERRTSNAEFKAGMSPIRHSMLDVRRSAFVPAPAAFP